VSLSILCRVSFRPEQGERCTIYLPVRLKYATVWYTFSHDIKSIGMRTHCSDIPSSAGIQGARYLKEEGRGGRLRRKPPIDLGFILLTVYLPLDTRNAFAISAVRSGEEASRG
jgi:hypothetical protein